MEADSVLVQETVDYRSLASMLENLSEIQHIFFPAASLILAIYGNPIVM